VLAAERHVERIQAGGIPAPSERWGLTPHGWGNGLGDICGWHEHGYEKVGYFVRGTIVFRTAGGDIELGPGDKMVLSPHTPHAATVGAQGVRCIEASRPPGDRWAAQRHQTVFPQFPAHIAFVGLLSSGLEGHLPRAVGPGYVCPTGSWTSWRAARPAERWRACLPGAFPADLGPLWYQGLVGTRGLAQLRHGLPSCLGSWPPSTPADQSHPQGRRGELFEYDAERGELILGLTEPAGTRRQL
jgi:hypothetical protein